MTHERPFLSAEWRNLVMLNYEVEPSVLASRVPAGCELDSWDGRNFVSVVGFLFLGTRVLGVPIPFHRDFEEVNLRFYVRHKSEVGWRRGVVFVRELVPKRAIAYIANNVYGENYRALPMRHVTDVNPGANVSRASYEWRQNGQWESVSATFSGEPVLPTDDAEETFITEHYWGYAQQPGRPTVEYEVEHPRWRVWQADTASLNCDVVSLYGSQFCDALSGSPSSAFIADGSRVVVRSGRQLK